MPKAGQTWTPEQRAKITAAKEARKAASGNNEANKAEYAQQEAKLHEPEAPPAPRQRQQYQPTPPKPTGSRWVMRAGKWDTDAMEDSALESGDMLNIPEELHPEGVTLQWVTHSVYEQEMPQHRAGFEKAGWLPVHPEDFDGRFDGMFAPKGAKGEINKDGLVLMAKPTDQVKKSRQRDNNRAKRQVQIKEQALYGGEMPGVMGADHPSARRFNHVNRSIERVAIPQDD